MTLYVEGIIYKQLQEFKYNQLTKYELLDNLLILYRSDKSVTKLNFVQIK